MDWHAAGLRRLDGIIWALVAGRRRRVAAGRPALRLQHRRRQLPRPRPEPACCCSPAPAITAATATTPISPPPWAAPPRSSPLPRWPRRSPMWRRPPAPPCPCTTPRSTISTRRSISHWRGLLAADASAGRDFHVAMRVIYMSMSVQMTAVVLVLGFSGRLAWLRVYTLAFILSALITIALSALCCRPKACGCMTGSTPPITRSCPSAHTSWPVFLGLRDGSYRLLMAVGAEGIITFPSLHAALAVIIIAALWPVPVARWICAVRQHGDAGGDAGRRLALPRRRAGRYRRRRREHLAAARAGRAPCCSAAKRRKRDPVPKPSRSQSPA